MGRQPRPQVVGTSNVDLFRKTEAFEEIDVDQPSPPFFPCDDLLAAPVFALRATTGSLRPPSLVYPCTGFCVAKAGLPAEAPPKGGRRLVEPGGIEPPTS